MGKASRKKALRRAGIGDYKLSEALVELVSPLMRDDMSLQERQSLFMVATLAWNIAIYPREQRGRQILNLIGGLPEMPGDLEAEIAQVLDGKPASADFPPEKLLLMELLMSLMARKAELYPHDRRLIGDVELREQGGRYHLQVASRLAPPDFGQDEA
jgi:hypothetical protein